MSDKKEYNFVSKPYDKTTEQLDEVIESRGYKKAVKSFQNKYPKLKIVDVWWVKNGMEIYKEQKLPMGRKKKLEG
jgi:hypothetical protein